MGEFTLGFKNFANKSKKQVDNIIRKTAFDLTSAIIMDTAVDKGRARGNWIVTVDSENNSTTTATDPSGRQTIAKAQASLLTPPNNAIYIQNNLDYIVGLEYGASAKSPQGMARVNILRFSNFLDNAVKANK